EVAVQLGVGEVARVVYGVLAAARRQLTAARRRRQRDHLARSERTAGERIPRTRPGRHAVGAPVLRAPDRETALTGEHVGDARGGLGPELAARDVDGNVTVGAREVGAVAVLVALDDAVPADRLGRGGRRRGGRGGRRRRRGTAAGGARVAAARRRGGAGAAAGRRAASGVPHDPARSSRGTGPAADDGARTSTRRPPRAAHHVGATRAAEGARTQDPTHAPNVRPVAAGAGAVARRVDRGPRVRDRAGITRREGATGDATREHDPDHDAPHGAPPFRCDAGVVPRAAATR